MAHRQVRMVPPGWIHPKNEEGCNVHLRDGKNFRQLVAQWDERSSKWVQGLRSDDHGGWVRLSSTEAAIPYDEWAGERPRQEDYMPQWTKSEATHFSLYEDVSLETPLSRGFATKSELARWFYQDGVPMVFERTLSYEEWMTFLANAP